MDSNIQVLEESYQKLNTTSIIEDAALPYVVFKVSIKYFEDYNKGVLDEMWKMAAINYNENPNFSKSFDRLYQFLIKRLINAEFITLKKIQYAYSEYKDAIIETVSDLIIEDIKNVEKQKNQIVSQEGFVDHVLNENKLYASNSREYFDMVFNLTKLDAFKHNDDGTIKAEVKDNKGEVITKASINKNMSFLKDEKQNEVWNKLIQEIDKFDELTADLLDLISSMWMMQEKTSGGYIYLDSKSILKILMPGETYFRERDHFKIMERITILANTHLSLRIKGKDAEDRKKELGIKSNDIMFTKYKKLFDVDDIEVVKKRSTKQPLGVYALKIRPAQLLIDLFGSVNLGFRVMDLKIIQYNPHKQRELKRLGRYLSFQWKIQMANGNLFQPFRVQTLLNRVNISKRYVGSRLIERLEDTLDQLTNDGIIAKWSYINEPTEEEMRTKGWIKYEWPKCLIKIEPSEEVLKLNKTPFNRDGNSIIDLPEKAIKEFLSPSIELCNFDKSDVKAALKRHHLTLAVAAKEIGISETTLSRYLRNKNVKTRPRSLEKIGAWLETKK